MFLEKKKKKVVTSMQKCPDGLRQYTHEQISWFVILSQVAHNKYQPTRCYRVYVKLEVKIGGVAGFISLTQCLIIFCLI